MKVLTNLREIRLEIKMVYHALYCAALLSYQGH